MRRQTLATILVLNLFACNLALASTNYNYQPVQTDNTQYYQQPLQYPQNNTLRGNVVMVPAGATVKAMLTAPLSSQYSTAGQTVSLALNNDFYYDDKLIAPAGSTLYGTVIEASKAKRAGINGKLCVRFTQILSSI